MSHQEIPVSQRRSQRGDVDEQKRNEEESLEEALTQLLVSLMHLSGEEQGKERGARVMEKERRERIEMNRATVCT